MSRMHRNAPAPRVFTEKVRSKSAAAVSSRQGGGSSRRPRFVRNWSFGLPDPECSDWFCISTQGYLKIGTW
uniref:Uncharacterized protein n=1 Tax=Oryza meridionalis TaxID=40149 RepID=A0A0E0E7X9_9ORYZ